MSQPVNASKLRAKDVIEVPVEACQIIKITRVPGQLKARNNYLVELTVVPLTGPWQECEGKFIVESSDLVPLVRKYTNKQKRREALFCFFAKIRDKIFGPKVEEIPSLPAPMTKKENAQWT